MDVRREESVEYSRLRKEVLSLAAIKRWEVGRSRAVPFHLCGNPDFCGPNPGPVVPFRQGVWVPGRTSAGQRGSGTPAGPAQPWASRD
jgi:hypothetical protein